MDNNVNLIGSKKKKNRRKRKNSYPVKPALPPPLLDPATTLQSLKTIANLLQMHQQFTLTGHTTKYVPGSQPKPLMTGPRVTKPMFSGLNMPGFSTPEPESTIQSSEQSTSLKKNVLISDSQENVTKTVNPISILQTSPHNPNMQAHNANNDIHKPQLGIQNKYGGNNDLQDLRDQSSKKDNQTSQSKTKGPSSSVGIRSNRFDDFEVYNSPSFINFEQEVDLNDDDLNLNRSIDNKNATQNDNKDKSVKKNIPSNFQTKLQEQYAKKLAMKNQSENKNVPILENPKDNPLLRTGQDEVKKNANKELLEGLSSDIKTVVKDNIKSNMKWHGNPQHNIYEQAYERLPAGIPRTFLQQNRLGAPQQQSYSQENPSSSNIPRLVQWTPNPNVTYNDSQIFVQTPNSNTNQPQAYSPTEIYQDSQNNEASQDGSESPDLLEPGSKRVSAFQRLGPLSQPKKPKLTINLCLNKEQAVREVVDETHLNIPVHDREDINNSTDEIVVKYLPYWPWKKTVAIRKSVTARHSKTVMMLEKEQMEEIYDKDSSLIMISVTGYPPTWTKEHLLDVLLDNLKEKSFIPCFIEFTAKECKFFVIRCRGALLYIHWFGFSIKKDDVELLITISQTLLTVKQIDFIPRLVLRKRLAAKYDGEKLDLSEFTLKKDISHFIYFPLNRVCNQSELVQLQSDVYWDHLTELDLSYNRITSIEGFHLQTTTPHLKILNLSHNYIDSVLVFLPCRNLPLKKLMLDGNPLCLDYIDPDHYVKVMKTIFSSLRELDGITITLKGDLPIFKRNYCPEDAKVIVDKFLEVFFPLLDSEKDDRQSILELYSKKAVMTITVQSKLRYDSAYKSTRNFSIKSQNLLEGNKDRVEGITNIGKLIKKWPQMQHDPTTFTTDVIYHDDSTTIFNITGILKVTAESLAEDEPLVAFSRTIVLRTKNGYKYKIQNEMVHWDEPIEEYSKIAFKTVTIPRKTLSLKFELTPDDDTKKRLINIFMKVTELEEKASERCLELKSWHFEHALEYFMKLLKLDNIQTLNTCF